MGEMMKIIERIWAFVFYCFANYEGRAKYLYKYLNPFFWLDNVKRIGTNKVDNFKVEFKNHLLYDNSSTMMWAGIDIAAYLSILVCIIFNIIGGRKIWRYILASKLYEAVFIILLVIICAGINYFILFRRKKFLIFFQAFDKINFKKKRLYALGCFIFLVITIAYFFYSFKY
jgi:hypothetical protein